MGNFVVKLKLTYFEIQEKVLPVNPLNFASLPS